MHQPFFLALALSRCTLHAASPLGDVEHASHPYLYLWYLQRRREALEATLPEFQSRAWGKIGSPAGLCYLQPFTWMFKLSQRLSKIGRTCVFIRILSSSRVPPKANEWCCSFSSSLLPAIAAAPGCVQAVGRQCGPGAHRQPIRKESQVASTASYRLQRPAASCHLTAGFKTKHFQK